MSEGRFTRVALAVWVVLIVLFLFVPIAIIVTYAFNPSNVQGWPIYGLSTKWFSQTWHNQEMRTAFGLSLKAAAVATTIALLLGTSAAFALHRFRFFGRGSVSLLLLIATAVNGIVADYQYQLTPEQFATWGPGYHRLIFGSGAVAGRISLGASGVNMVRPFGLGSDVGFSGNLAALAAPAALALLTLSHRRITRLLAFALAGGVVLALVASQARISIIAAVFSLFPQSTSQGTGNFQKVTQVIPVKIGFEDVSALNNFDLVPGMNVTVHIHKH